MLKYKNQEYAHAGAVARAVRLELKMSLTQAANAVDVSPQFLCDVELGRRLCTTRLMAGLEMLAKLPELALQRYVVDDDVLKFLRGEPELVAALRRRMKAGAGRPAV